MARITLRPATADDFARMVEGPLPYRCRAFAAERDGELLGIGGLTLLPEGAWAAFALMKHDARRHKVALHKAGLRAMDEARRLGIPRVVALAEPGVEPAKRWLARLGFEPHIIDGQEVWTWLRSRS